MRFCRYGCDGPRVYVEFSDLLSLSLAGDVIARAEDSGSEGCYVEVARWKSLTEFDGHWLRFAYLKCFGGEDMEGSTPDSKPFGEATYEPVATAKRIAERINQISPFRQSFIHRLPNWKEAAK